MKKIHIIKNVMGTQLISYGFEYFKTIPNTWIFRRKFQDVDQFVNVFESNFTKSLRLEIYTSIDMDKILEINNFHPDWEKKYSCKYFWDYHDEISFTEIIKEFTKIIIEYGLKALDELSIPTRNSLIKVTPDMHLTLFKNHYTLCKEYMQKYNVTIRNVKEGIVQIINLQKEKKNLKYEEMKDLLIEIASYYGEALIYEFGGKWTFQDKDNFCIIELTLRDGINEILPLHDIVFNWRDIEEFDEYLLMIYKELCSIQYNI